MDKYLNDEEISVHLSLRTAIRKGCIDNTFVPTLCGSAFKNKGVQRLLDAVVNLFHLLLMLVRLVGLDPKDNDIEKNRKPE